MKVKELIDILKKCDQEAIVTNKDCRNFSRSLYYWELSVDGIRVTEGKYDSIGSTIQKIEDVPLEKANVILL